MTSVWWLSAFCSRLIYPVPCCINAEQRIGLGTLTSTSYATAWDLVSVIIWLTCTHTLDVTLWVPSQVVGSSEPCSSCDQSIVRTCFVRWGIPGNHPGTYSRSCKYSVQTVHIIHENSGHQHSPTPAFLRTAWELHSTQLPPCDDCLFMHTKHVKAQL